MPTNPNKRGPKKQLEITPTQRRTLLEIESFIRQHEFAPTMQELAERLEISGPSVHEQITQLVKKGYLRKADGKVRGLVLLRRAQDKPPRLIPIPLLGTVAAGPPKLAEEDKIGEILVPDNEFQRDECFALRVDGDSMKNAGICNGDIVIVRRQPLAQSGDIVVALVDGEATVKRLYFRDNVIELHPDSPVKKFRPIPIGRETDLRIVGRVVSVRGATT